jgi:DNA-binding NarL/FixJ family response regulator
MMVGSDVVGVRLVRDHPLAPARTNCRSRMRLMTIITSAVGAFQGGGQGVTNAWPPAAGPHVPDRRRTLKRCSLGYRVLVVEDHERWRRHLCSVLANAAGCEVIGAASEGWEAVQKIETLKPDLILMDIGLPGIDGIEAARQVIARDPRSRILFVSEHQSSDIVQTALRSGARGYITKSDAARELLPAMEAIVQERRFIGARFGGRSFEAATDMEAARELRHHEVGLHSDEASLLEDYARFSEAAVRAGTSLIVVLSQRRADLLHQKLRARGVDVDGALRQGRYLVLEVLDTVSRFLIDGRLDEARFWSAATTLIIEAARAVGGSRRRVAACGECAPTLMREGMVQAAMALERLWDDVARTFDVDVFCGYLIGDLRCDGDNPALETICASHSAVRGRQH